MNNISEKENKKGILESDRDMDDSPGIHVVTESKLI